MPIFEYRCQDCATKFEKLVRREGDIEALECPGCGRKNLSRELSTFAAHAGSGSKAPDGPPCARGACNPAACPMHSN